MDVNIIAILLVLVVNLLKRYSSKVSSLIMTLTYSQSPEQKKSQDAIIAEIKVATEKRDALNPVDEFAQYALAGRELTKLNEQLKESRAKDTSARMRSLMLVKTMLMLFVWGSSVALIWNFYDTPVIRFREMMDYEGYDMNLFYPFGGLLAFPCTRVANSIGVTLWLVITNRLVDIVVNKLPVKV